MLQLNWNLIYTIINLLVLYVILKKFLFKPVTAMMEKREQLIADNIDSAKKQQEEAKKIKEDYETLLINAREEARQIVAEAKAHAQKEYDAILQKAQQDAQLHLEQAKKAIEEEKQNALKGAYNDIAKLSILAASKVCTKNIDTEANQKLVEEFLDEAGVAS